MINLACVKGEIRMINFPRVFLDNDGILTEVHTTEMRIDHNIYDANTISIEGILETDKFDYLTGTNFCSHKNDIKNVIFAPPATIVFWNDGTKTVVKCQEGDEFSKEIGLAMAICKKHYGNKGNYNKVFDKWIGE